MNGKGDYHYANGDNYVGEWLDDQKHGEGEYVYAVDGTKLVGKWVLNAKQGEFKSYKKDKAEPEIVTYKNDKNTAEVIEEHEEVKLQALGAEEASEDQTMSNTAQQTPQISSPASSEAFVAL